MAEEKFEQKDLDEMVLNALKVGEKGTLDEGRKKSVKDRLLAFARGRKTPKSVEEIETE